VKVELLYFDGCPNYVALAPRLRHMVESAGVSAGIELRRVVTEEEARRLRFLGSPTVRVDGRDVESGAGRRDDWGLKCRLYRGPEGLLGLPADELIVAAVDRAGRA
jgi:hypothetical protein